MATAASQQLYPLSDESGKAIPLDIIRPLGSIKWALPFDAALPITIPAEFALVSMFSNVDCVLDFTGDLVYPAANATLYASALIIPADTILTVAIPSNGAARLIPLGAKAGTVVMNCIQKWAGLGLQRQLGNR